MATVNDNRCEGEHRFFVSEVKGTTADDAVWVIKVCTSCDRVQRLIIPLDPTKPVIHK